jgi:hypothetical protein
VSGDKSWPLHPKHQTHGRSIEIFSDLFQNSPKNVRELAKTKNIKVVDIYCLIWYWRPDQSEKDAIQNIKLKYCYDLEENKFYLDV